jgi:uncharacterized protein (TIGR03437 family)
MSVRHVLRRAVPLLLACAFAGASLSAGSPATISVGPDFLFFRQTGSATVPPAQLQVATVGAFTAAAATKSGGNWLSVSPATGTGPATLTVSVNTTGMAVGEYSGSITISGAATAIVNGPAVVGVLLEVTGSSQNTLVVRPQQLEFDAVAGGSAPPAQAVMIVSPTAAAQNWTATASVTTPPGGSWLKLAATSGSSATALKVMADPTGLAAGSYAGTVMVAMGSATASVGVAFNVAAAKPPALGLDPPVMFFDPDNTCLPPMACPVSTTSQPRILNIANSGSGSIAWTATVALDSGAGSPWLSISPTSGTTPSQATVSVSSTGLAAGIYSGRITVTGGGQTVVERVYLEVDGTQQPAVHVYPKAMEFHFGESVVTPASRKVHITSQASGLSYTATATTAKGGNWLSISPSSGPITSSSFLTASVSASVAGSLAPGWYTGRIEIQTPGASQKTHEVFVALKVHAPNETKLLEVEPGGIGFSAVVGAASPGPQSVLLEVNGGASLAWTAAVATASGGSWLSATPLSGSATTAITVSVNTAGLSAGVYDGTVVFTPAASSGSNTVTLRVRLVMNGAGQASPGQATINSSTAADATTATYAGYFSAPSTGFVSENNMPLSVIFNLMDPTGAPVAGAMVTVTSSNGEPSLALNDNGDGSYSGIFQPLVAGPLVLTANRQVGTIVANSVSVSGDIESSTQSNALVYQGGAVSAASYAPAPTPLTAGALVSLFGRNLTTSGGAAASLPLPTSLGGVGVTVGGFPAGLISADATQGQINLQIPWEVQGSAQADILVNTGGTITPPQTVMLSAAAPALFTMSQNGTGAGAFLHADYSAISSSAPATAGEVVLLYASGLGAVQTPVADGAASGGLNATTAPVSVMIGGQQATVQYAGLAPNYAGLYQINVTIPSGIASGSALVVVSVNGVTTTGQATIAVQ